MKKQGGFLVLSEIICDKFKQKKVNLHNGLNVILGDNDGSNSIGKSTFLMIIDYIFGGNDYVMKSTDIQKNVGNHVVKFSFLFNEKDYYYFSRNTEDTVYVNVCDKDYNVEKQISLDEYTKQLSELYNIFVQSISFRDIVGRYIRVYGKDNLDEKQPLHIVKNEKAGQPINALLKLFDLYSSIKQLEELANKKSDEFKAFSGAQKYKFISDIGKRQRDKNDKLLQDLQNKKEEITERLNKNLLDFTSEKADIVLTLKRELADYNKKIRAQKSKLILLQENLEGKRIIEKEDMDNIQKFFPEVNLKLLVEVQHFHKEIGIVLKEEIKDEIKNIQGIINIIIPKKEIVEEKLKEISETSNLSQVVLIEFAEIQKQIEKIESEIEFYDKKITLDKEKKDAEQRKKNMKDQQIAQLQNSLNIKMCELNTTIYQGGKVPPTIFFDNNKYIFETVDDSGTGTNYRGMILYDLSVLELTCLPVLVHDSVVLKQIEDFAIEKILGIYEESKKQIFIALDKVPSYSKESQKILHDKKVLELSSNGNELFGKSWSKN